MNRAESDRLAGRFDQSGYTATDDITRADLIVINSCVVRASAESRVVNKLHVLRRLKKARPDIRMAVTGCFVGNDLLSLKKRFPHVDWFFKAGDPPPWLEGAAEPVLPPVSRHRLGIISQDAISSVPTASPVRRGRNAASFERLYVRCRRCAACARK